MKIPTLRNPRGRPASQAMRRRFGFAAAVAVVAATLAAAQTCAYTCWDADAGTVRYAACVGGDVAPSAALTGIFLQEGGVCGSCGHPTGRVKGYWPSADDNSWAWVDPVHLSNPRACPPPAADRNGTLRGGAPCTPKCVDAGLYTVAQPGGAMVRGGAGDNGCGDHLFLGWLLTGETISITGDCDGTCCWAAGYAYGNVNNVASVEGSELAPS